MYGQSEEQHGEKYFHRRILKEFQFDILKTNYPEAMNLVIKEYQLIPTGPDLIHDVKRKLLCTSQYQFFHDEDEDYAVKVALCVIDKGGEVISNLVYTQRDSENRQYWDIGYIIS